MLTLSRLDQEAVAGGTAITAVHTEKQDKAVPSEATVAMKGVLRLGCLATLLNSGAAPVQEGCTFLIARARKLLLT